MSGAFFLEHCGCRLQYCLAGSGPPVVFIQGVAVHGNGWSPQIEALAQHYRCLSFDNRGMPGSQPIGEPFSIEQMAQDAEALMDAAGFDDAHVVGHSMGGLIALALALRAKRRVRSLSLLCTFASGRDAAPPTARMLWLGLRARIGPRRARRRAFLELILPKSVVDAADSEELAARFRDVFGRDLADHPPIEMKQLYAMRAFDAKPGLADLASIPTLVVTGAHDPIAPPALGRQIAAALGGARYVEMADASHGAPIQHPERMNQLLMEHFERAR
jgi:pimeloyl-ACP methyl ester carboxylesterase